MPFLCVCYSTPLSHFWKQLSIINIFLTQFLPKIIQDKYSLWYFYIFSACLIPKITFRKTRESWATHLSCMWDTRGPFVHINWTLSMCILWQTFCIPAFKLFHSPVWSNATGSLGMAAGVQAVTCCLDLSEYMNGKRNSPSEPILIPWLNLIHRYKPPTLKPCFKLVWLMQIGLACNWLLFFFMMEMSRIDPVIRNNCASAKAPMLF